MPPGSDAMTCGAAGVFLARLKDVSYDRVKERRPARYKEGSD